MIINNLPWRTQLHLLGTYEAGKIVHTTLISVKVGEEIATFDLMQDERVRKPDQAEATGRWATRKVRPWLKVLKEKGQTGITLTSEGKRHLYQLRTVAETTGTPLNL